MNFLLLFLIRVINYYQDFLTLISLHHRNTTQTLTTPSPPTLFTPHRYWLYGERISGRGNLERHRGWFPRCCAVQIVSNESDSDTASPDPQQAAQEVPVETKKKRWYVDWISLGWSLNWFLVMWSAAYFKDTKCDLIVWSQFREIWQEQQLVNDLENGCIFQSLFTLGWSFDIMLLRTRDELVIPMI